MTAGLSNVEIYSHAIKMPLATNVMMLNTGRHKTLYVGVDRHLHLKARLRMQTGTRNCST